MPIPRAFSTRPILITLASLSVAATTLAHVFWVQPINFHPASGDIIKLQLRVGDTFPGEIVPRTEEKIDKFVIVGPKAETERAVTGRDADPIAGVVRSTDAGTFMVAYRSKASSVTLEADKFETYLREKGLEKIIARRAESKQTAKAARENFSRSAKTIFQIGGTPTEGPATKELGLRVEIIPKSDPSTLKPGGTLSIVVKSEGKPFDNALVQARNADHPESGLSARTDNQGRVAFKLPSSGMWVIDAVDMFPAPPTTEADWESVWASLTFEIPADAPSLPKP